MIFAALIAYVSITGIITYTVHTAIVGAIDTAQRLFENRYKLAVMSREAKPAVLNPCPLCEGSGSFKNDSDDTKSFYVECQVCGCFTYAYLGNDGDEYALADWNRGIVYLPDPEEKEPEEKPEEKPGLEARSASNDAPI